MMPYVKSPLHPVITLQKQDLSLCLRVCLLSVCIWCLEGEILATMEENSREFLYGRLSDGEGAEEREMLMKKSSSFPVGCFPVLLFIYFLIYSFKHMGQ